MNEPTIRKVSFGITGEFITNHVRDLWREGSFKKAFDVLETLDGITLDQMRLIIDGKAKLEGLNTLDLVDDQWIPDEEYRLFSTIFTAVEQFEKAEEIIQEYHYDKVEGLKRTYAYIFDRGECGTAHAKEVKTQLEIALKKQNYGETFAMFFRDLSQPKKSYTHLVSDDYGMNAARQFEAELKSKNLDDMIKLVGDRGYESTEKPVEDKELEGRYGWITDKGKFYACGYMEHIGLAYNLLKDEVGEDANHERVAEERGWLKISSSGTFGKSPNKKQLNILFDWCEKHSKDYEKEMRFIVDDD